jgi:hypothetical protein
LQGRARDAGAGELGMDRFGERVHVVAAYVASRGRGWLAASEAVFRIAPLRRATIAGSSAPVT